MAGQSTENAGTRRRTRALGVAGAVVATAVVGAVGELLGHDLVLTSPGQPATDLGVGALAFVALAASLLGWAALAALERWTSRAGRIWTVLALVVLAASYLPFLGVEASTGSKVVLALTHLAVAAVLIPVFRSTTGSRDRVAAAARG